MANEIVVPEGMLEAAVAVSSRTKNLGVVTLGSVLWAALRWQEENETTQIAALTAEVARLKELVEEADKSIQAKLNKHSETARIYKDLGLQACSDHEQGVVFGLSLALRAIRPIAAPHAAAPQATEKG